MVKNSGGLVRPAIVIVVLLLLSIVVPIVTASTVSCCLNSETFTCEGGLEFEECPSGDRYLSDQLCVAVAECQSGCCCADPSAPNPDEWNNDENSVWQTGFACSQYTGSGAYTFQPGGSVADCLAICNNIDPGTGTGPDPDRYTITGSIAIDGVIAIDGDAVATIGSASAATDDSGFFSLANVPLSGPAILYASVPDDFLCSPASVTVVPSAPTINVGTIDVQCEVAACTLDVLPTIDVALIPGSSSVSLQLSHDDPCESFVEYNVIRYKNGNFDRELSTLSNALTDNLLAESGVEYCYAVAAEYSGSGFFPLDITSRPQSCVTLGDARCMDGDVAWCDNSGDTNTVVTCDENNQVIESPCAIGQICSSQGSSPQCVAAPLCDQCNGPFGLYANEEFMVYDNGVQERLCSTLPLCYLDRSLTVVDKHKSCSAISSCDDYLSSGACNENNCDVPESCLWTVVNEELGLGVCMASAADPPCAACEEMLGFCSQSFCNAIGGGYGNGCYYDAEKNGLNQDILDSLCMARSDVACRFYDTEEECIGPGGRAVAVNVQYSGSNRVSGTNSLSSHSGDLFNLGVCAWDAESSSCYANRDGLITNPSSGPVDDCFEDISRYNKFGLHCLRDSTPPATTLILPGSVLSLHELSSLEYFVVDDYVTQFGADVIETYFCVDTAGTCYPDNSLQELLQEIDSLIDTIGKVETFTIRYYSVDPSQNLEVVKSEDIAVIDVGIPLVLEVSLER